MMKFRKLILAAILLGFSVMSNAQNVSDFKRIENELRTAINEKNSAKSTLLLKKYCASEYYYDNEDYFVKNILKSANNLYDEWYRDWAMYFFFDAMNIVGYEGECNLSPKYYNELMEYYISLVYDKIYSKHRKLKNDSNDSKECEELAYNYRKYLKLFSESDGLDKKVKPKIKKTEKAMLMDIMLGNAKLYRVCSVPSSDLNLIKSQAQGIYREGYWVDKSNAMIVKLGEQALLNKDEDFNDGRIIEMAIALYEGGDIKPDKSRALELLLDLCHNVGSYSACDYYNKLSE